MENTQTVAGEIISKVEGYLRAQRRDQIRASCALYVLNLAAAVLGRDKQDEAEEFKEGLDDINVFLQGAADPSEYHSNMKMIRMHIDQVLNPEQHEYSTRTHIESKLEQQKERLLNYLQ